MKIQPKYHDTLLLGHYNNVPPTVHMKYRIPFSVNFEEYFKIFSQYIYSDVTFKRVRTKINKFIDSCLIMGGFLYKNRYFRVSEHMCSTFFNVSFEDRIYGEFCIFKISILSVSEEEVVILIDQIEYSKNMQDYHSNTFKTTDRICPDIVPGYLIGLDSNNRDYFLRNEVFIPPPFSKLPLYINAPYLKEYARHMLKNPPPPPRYIDKKFFI